MKYVFVVALLVSLFFNGYMITKDLKTESNDTVKNIKMSVAIVRYLEAKVNRVYISKGKELFVKPEHLTPEYEGIQSKEWWTSETNVEPYIDWLIQALKNASD